MPTRRVKPTCFNQVMKRLKSYKGHKVTVNFPSNLMFLRNKIIFSCLGINVVGCGAVFCCNRANTVKHCLDGASNGVVMEFGLNIPMTKFEWMVWSPPFKPIHTTPTACDSGKADILPRFQLSEPNAISFSEAKLGVFLYVTSPECC